MGSNKINILLADDDKDDCLLFKDALEELQTATEFTAVNDGDQLMRLLKKQADHLPDVLFLDLNMPRRNGLSCLKELKSDDKLKQLPVIIFSTSYEQSVADILYKYGAHSYICKPAAFMNLKKVIQQALLLVSKYNSSQPSRENFILNNLITLCE